MTTLLDPFISGRGDTPVSTMGATPFAARSGFSAGFGTDAGPEAGGNADEDEDVWRSGTS